MAHLIAIAALNVGGAAGLSAISGLVTTSIAILARIRVVAWLCAITCTVALFFAVDTFNSGGCFLTLNNLLLAVLLDVAELVAVATHRHAAVYDDAGRFEAFQILSGISGPSISHVATTRLLGTLKGEDILAVLIANRVHDSHMRRDFLLQGNKVDAAIRLAESSLKARQSKVGIQGTSVRLEGNTERIEIGRFARRKE